MCRMTICRRIYNSCLDCVAESALNPYAEAKKKSAKKFLGRLG